MCHLVDKVLHSEREMALASLENATSQAWYSQNQKPKKSKQEHLTRIWRFEIGESERQFWRDHVASTCLTPFAQEQFSNALAWAEDYSVVNPSNFVASIESFGSVSTHHITTANATIVADVDAATTVATTNDADVDADAATNITTALEGQLIYEFIYVDKRCAHFTTQIVQMRNEATQSVQVSNTTRHEMFGQSGHYGQVGVSRHHPSRILEGSAHPHAHMYPKGSAHPPPISTGDPQSLTLTLATMPQPSPSPYRRPSPSPVTLTLYSTPVVTPLATDRTI